MLNIRLRIWLQLDCLNSLNSQYPRGWIGDILKIIYHQRLRTVIFDHKLLTLRCNFFWTPPKNNMKFLVKIQELIEHP